MSSKLPPLITDHLKAILFLQPSYSVTANQPSIPVDCLKSGTCMQAYFVAHVKYNRLLHPTSCDLPLLNDRAMMKNKQFD